MSRPGRIGSSGRVWFAAGVSSRNCPGSEPHEYQVTRRFLDTPEPFKERVVTQRGGPRPSTAGRTIPHVGDEAASAPRRAVPGSRYSRPPATPVCAETARGPSRGRSPASVATRRAPTASMAALRCRIRHQNAIFMPWPASLIAGGVHPGRIDVGEPGATTHSPHPPPIIERHALVPSRALRPWRYVSFRRAQVASQFGSGVRGWASMDPNVMMSRAVTSRLIVPSARPRSIM